MIQSHRRRRIARVTIAPKREIGSAARRWLIILSTVAAAVGTVVIIGTKSDHLPFVVGRIADREIRVKHEFSIVNEGRTENEREKYARLSPPVFQHDSKPIRDLGERLIQTARAIARAKRFEDLSEITLGDWKGKLTPEGYSALKLSLENENALLDFAGKLNQSLERLAEYGVLDSAELPPDLERDTGDVETWSPDSPGTRRTAREDVLLTNLTRPEGRLYRELASYWKPVQAETLFQMIAARLIGTLTFDVDRTRATEQEYRESVQPIVDQYRRGYLVVPQGTAITDEQIRLLTAETAAIRGDETWIDRLSKLIGFSLIVAALLICLAFYIRTYETSVASDPIRLAALVTVCLATLTAARFSASAGVSAELLPVAATSLLIAIAYDRAFALVMAFVLSILTSLLEPQPMESFMLMLGGTATGISLLDSVRSRYKLINVGVMVGVTFGLLSIATGLLDRSPWSVILLDAARRFGWGVTAGFLVGGCLPFVEAAFGIVTDISLLELADTSHPLLQELIRRAPGTYNHSATVSIIAESAAGQIGCNSLVVRVGALFHDIGKMLKPEYFVENRSGGEENRHKELEPALSALIIIGHVKDGVELAHQHRLPEQIIELIEQHHGTTLVDYFYREAKATDDQDETVEESAYRYPGPRPQSKEAAVLMLADCVEGACRALNDPTAASIEKVVRRLSRARLLDNQFSESGLTLEEIRTIEDSLIKSMSSVYHGRIQYPVAV